MEIKDCSSFLIFDFSNEADLLKAIEELSRKFTVERNKLGDYLKDPRLTAAYAAFYLTTNVPKLAAVMEWMPQEWKEHLKRLPLLDMGAGPGTFSIAWREWVGEAFKGVHQIETSDLMRQQATKLWSGLYPAEAHKLQHGSPSKNPASLMLFGHSANEMGAQVTLNYVDALGSDELLFIEPGTKTFFPEMIKIREGLLERGYNILFPCPSSSACPLAQSERDWCHQYVTVTHPPEIERLSQKMHLDRKLFPLIVQAYSKTHQHQTQERIVRVHPETKFSFEWDVCSGEKVERYQLLRKHLSREDQKHLAKVLAGAAIETAEEKVLESAKRVKLKKLGNRFFQT
jgi:hypothetical protein